MPAIDFAFLTINKIIIHDIPKHKKNDHNITPSYSEQESVITEGMRLFFQEKIKTALNSPLSFKVCFNNNENAIVSSYISRIIESDANYIENSKEIAKSLFIKQMGSNAAGILLIIRGDIEDKKVCVVMKLERDNGAKLVLNEDTKSYNIEEVRDLMLTHKTKVFKVAFFVDRTDFNIDYDGLLMDYQINLITKKETNTFFMNFLECIALYDPKIKTQKFYSLTKKFIDTIENPLTRSKYIQDMNSYLQNNLTIVSPEDFANNFMIDTEHKNNYKILLEEEDFTFDSFIKDRTLVNSFIDKICIEFENDIFIVGKGGSFEDKVILTPEGNNGQYKAEILSKIKKIK